MKPFPFALITDKSIVVVYSHNVIETYQRSSTTYKHVGDIIDAAYYYGVYNVWLMPFTDISCRFDTQFLLDALPAYQVSENYQQKDSEQEHFFRSWKKEGDISQRKTVTITAIEHSNLWRINLDGITSKEFLQYVLLLHVYLDIPVAISPGYTGIELLKRCNSKQRITWLENADLSNLPDRSTSFDIKWLASHFQDAMFLHVVDKSGAYLASGNSVQVGEGTPTHVEGIAFDKKLCGLWHVTFTGESPYDGTSLPLPYHSVLQKPLSYYWTPEIEIAMLLGYGVEVKEAWIFKERHKIFNLWSNFLWDIRIKLRTLRREYPNVRAYKLADDTIKLIYTHTFGKLATSSEYEKKDTTFLRRDWRNMIVADTRLKVLYQLNKLVQAGYQIVMVNVDALYILTNVANPHDIGIISQEDKLGGYKLKYSFLWSEVQDIFSSVTSRVMDSRVNQIAEKLNLLAQERK